MPDLPPLESIRAFEAAARHDSFVRAGQELGVTAATISHRVQALETHIGAQLFSRHARGVRLNVRGREYAGEIQRIFAELSNATERHREHADATHLKLVAVEVVAEKWLMPRLADFRAAHPDISIEFETDHREVDPERRDFRRLDRLHRPGRRDTPRRDAVQGNADSGLQPGLPEDPGAAPRAGGPARLAAAVRPALDNLLVALVRAPRGRGSGPVARVGVPALQHDGPGRGRRDGRRPRPLADDRPRARAGNTGLPVRLSCQGAGPVPAGHNAGIRQETPGTSVPGLGPTPGQRAIRAGTNGDDERHPARWKEKTQRGSQGAKRPKDSGMRERSADRAKDTTRGRSTTPSNTEPTTSGASTGAERGGNQKHEG